MSDMVEHYRDVREIRRENRKLWHECETCRASFGTGTDVPPGERCRNCGWTAPGERDERVSLGYRRGRGRSR